MAISKCILNLFQTIKIFIKRNRNTVKETIQGEGQQFCLNMVNFEWCLTFDFKKVDNSGIRKLRVEGFYNWYLLKAGS